MGPVRVINIRKIIKLIFTFSFLRKMYAAMDRKIEAMGDFSKVIVFASKPNIKNITKSNLYFFFLCIEDKNNDPIIPNGINKERNQKNK
jgi:hypothetical protein